MAEREGVEPLSSAWKAVALPLSYTRQKKGGLGFLPVTGYPLARARTFTPARIVPTEGARYRDLASPAATRQTSKGPGWLPAQRRFKPLGERSHRRHKRKTPARMTAGRTSTILIRELNCQTSLTK